MRRIQLMAEEHEALQHTSKAPQDRHLRECYQAVLMANRGRKREAMAHDLGYIAPP